MKARTKFEQAVIAQSGHLRPLAFNIEDISQTRYKSNCFSMVDAKNRKLCRTPILTPTFQEVKMSLIFRRLSELCLWNYLAMWVLDCF